VSLASFRLSGPARLEVVKILKSSASQFGTEAARRYRALIEQAVADLVDEPDRLGVKHVDGLLHYHLRHSQNRIAGGRVRAPRHVLVCKIQVDILVVLAVGHDAMEEGLRTRIEEGEAG
jgi:toxin ParE1/3/4